MFGGGEQYFQEPTGFSIEMLKHYAVFASKLRSIDSIKGKSIQEACALAKAVGNTVPAFELVVGLLFRHIKTWRDTKQLATWYILHQLCRDEPDKYGHEANKYVMEVGCDFIPWENPQLAPKYEQLVQKWNADRLFSDEAVRRIWQSKADRAEQINNPARYRAELLEEEAVWREEDIRQQNEGKLNESGQPCLDYLQGSCTWGNACKMLHPPGLQGTLPPECRLGDWKCSCGTINRHFRRRCSTCPKEKPQYRRNMQQSEEDRLLSKPEELGDVFRYQFGYDVNNTEACVRYWTQRLASYSAQQWREERSDAYRRRILGNNTSNNATNSGLSSSSALNFPAEPIAEAIAPDEVVPATKKHRAEGEARHALAAHQGTILAASQKVRMPTLPSLSPSERIPFVARRIIDSGIADANLGELLYLLSVSIKDVAMLKGGMAANLTPTPATALEPLYTVCTLVYAGWNTGKVPTVAKPFFEDLYPLLIEAPPPPQQQQMDDGPLSLPLPAELYGQLLSVMPSDKVANMRAMAKDVVFGGAAGN